jgi:hypothetical protein
MILPNKYKIRKRNGWWLVYSPFSRHARKFDSWAGAMAWVRLVAPPAERWTP